MTASDAENLRTMRHMRDRDPVENAVMALACLPDPLKAEFVARFNAIFDGDRVKPVTVTVHIGRVAQ